MGNLVPLHLLGEAYGKRPSDILGVANTWAAYQLDMATLLAGRNAERERIEKGRKSNDAVPTKPKGFKSAEEWSMALGAPIRKVKIPESGIW